MPFMSNFHLNLYMKMQYCVLSLLNNYTLHNYPLMLKTKVEAKSRISHSALSLVYESDLLTASRKWCHIAFQRITQQKNSVLLDYLLVCFRFGNSIAGAART